MSNRYHSGLSPHAMQQHHHHHHAAQGESRSSRRIAAQGEYHDDVGTHHAAVEGSLRRNKRYDDARPPAQRSDRYDDARPPAQRSDPPSAAQRSGVIHGAGGGFLISEEHNYQGSRRSALIMRGDFAGPPLAMRGVARAGPTSRVYDQHQMTGQRATTDGRDFTRGPPHRSDFDENSYARNPGPPPGEDYASQNPGRGNEGSHRGDSFAPVEARRDRNDRLGGAHAPRGVKNFDRDHSEVSKQHFRPNDSSVSSDVMRLGLDSTAKVRYSSRDRKLNEGEGVIGQEERG